MTEPTIFWSEQTGPGFVMRPGQCASMAAGQCHGGHSFGIQQHRVGLNLETDPRTGELVCVDPGTVVWSNAWPVDALIRIGDLEREIEALRAQLGFAPSTPLHTAQSDDI